MKKEEKQDLLLQALVYIILYSVALPIYILFHKTCFNGVSGYAGEIIGSASFENEPKIFYIPLIIVGLGKILYHWSKRDEWIKKFILTLVGFIGFNVTYGIVWFVFLLFTNTHIPKNAPIFDYYENYHTCVPILLNVIFWHIGYWASKDDK